MSLHFQSQPGRRYVSQHVRALWGRAGLVLYHKTRFDIGMIGGDLFGWSLNNANNVKEEPAVFELYDASNTLIYIGSTSNLRIRFRNYLSTNLEWDPCKQRTRGYRRQYVGSESEARLLEEAYVNEYKQQHGAPPPCNK